MQYCVTRKTKKKSIKSRKNKAFATIIFFVIIFAIMVLLGASKRENLIFQQDYFYLVYATADTCAYVVESGQSEIKKIGGAGTIFKKDNNYYLAVNVYHSEKDAEEILRSVKKTYAGAGIYKFNIKPVSRENKNKIKKDTKLLKLFELMKSYLVDFENDCINFSLGEISEGKLLKKLIQSKLLFEDYINGAKGESEICKLVVGFAQMYQKQIEDFINGFYENQNKESYCFDQSVKLVMIFAGLCENL